MRAFGSRATWNAKDYSDLDLAVIGDEPLPRGAVARLKEAFEESRLPMRVDVVDWHSIAEGFRQSIEMDCVVVREPAPGGARHGTGDWERTTLGTIVHLLSGGTPSKRKAHYWGGALPWVSAKDMKEFRLSDTEDHLTEDGVANGARVAPGGSVLLLTRGMTLLNDLPVCVIQRPMAFNQDVKALRSTDAVDDRFLPYLILGNKHRLLGLVDLAGHGTGRLNSDELRALEVSLPPLEEQRAIARVLGALDDRIELNRRMSETLEEMARALFRSWFVDFEPVRAKAEGRPSGLPPALDALFPASFEASELGEIPAGWGVKALGGAFRITMGQSPPGKTYNQDGDGLPFYQGRTDFGFRFPSRRVYCTAPTRLAEPGDSLVSVRAPVGDVNMAMEPCCVGRGVAAVRHHSGSRSYTYYSMQSLRDTFERFEAEGTVFGSVSKKDFHAMPWVSPPQALVAQFETSCSLLDGRIETNERATASLAAQRDALLPRLVSGEVRIESRGGH